MEFEIIRQEGNEVEFLVKGERHTLPNLLRSRLARDPEVDFVAYTLRHPSDADARFILRTKTKPCAKVLADACTAISGELAELQKVLKKTLK